MATFKAPAEQDLQPGSSHPFPSHFSVLGSLARIRNDILTRLTTTVTNTSTVVVSTLAILPGVNANEGGWVSLNDTDPTYREFVAGSSNDTAVRADISNFMNTGLEFPRWKAQADAIRSSQQPYDCIGNLSLALSQLGAAYSAGSQGATGLLTLLPTAGALIGAPAKELWVLYKLMPVAGVLSMMVSLGGSIVPMELNQYETVHAFNYQGFIATEQKHGMDEGAITSAASNEVDKFAERVHNRASSRTGSRPSGLIAIGCALQCLWIVVILIICWMLASGTIIVWWCKASGWTYMWYGAVMVSSIFENVAGIPFTRQWSIRISRAPVVGISDDAPWVVRDLSAEENPQQDFIAPKGQRRQTEITTIGLEEPSGSTSSQSLPPEGLVHTSSGYASIPASPSASTILDRLEKGYNTVGKILFEREKAWSAAGDVFYVLISEKGVSHWHAFGRIASKFLSIAVFTFGTALFASTALITITIAMIAAVFILTCGIFGRVTAMWMASEMMRNKPVLHRVVENREEAAKYIEAILRKPDMTCEILGHVVVGGRCVKRFRKYPRWSHFFGVLASPYDLERLSLST